jgi:hypothetical protein
MSGNSPGDIRMWDSARREPWNHNKFLTRPNFALEVKEIETASSYLSASNVGCHRFFDAAKVSLLALRLWSEQELVISSMFSQAVAAWISSIHNCHIRAAVIPVLAGEHGKFRRFEAVGAHPILAEGLCISLFSNLDAIPVLDPTRDFLIELAGNSKDPMMGAGFLGIGNEKMLLPEYRAVRHCFANIAPQSSFHDFLDANIDEDEGHHRLIELSVRGLVSIGYDAEQFLQGAIRGVDARIAYLDKLFEFYANDCGLVGLLSSTIPQPSKKHKGNTSSVIAKDPT